MGFGTLLLGYLIGCNFVYNELTDVFGFLLMLYGITSLMAYEERFRLSRLFLYPLTGISVIAFFFQALQFIGIIGNAQSFLFWYSPARTLLFAGVTVSALQAIKGLTKDLELSKLYLHAYRNQFAAVLYAVLQFYSDFSYPAGSVFSSFAYYLMLPLLGFGAVLMLFNLKLLFDCMASIGDEEEEARAEAELPPSLSVGKKKRRK